MNATTNVMFDRFLTESNLWKDIRDMYQEKIKIGTDVITPVVMIILAILIHFISTSIDQYNYSIGTKLVLGFCSLFLLGIILTLILVIVQKIMIALYTKTNMFRSKVLRNRDQLIKDLDLHLKSVDDKLECIELNALIHKNLKVKKDKMGLVEEIRPMSADFAKVIRKIDDDNLKKITLDDIESDLRIIKEKRSEIQELQAKVLSFA